uniref:FYVE-type domain-containing protein n=1 Tax=Phytophthora ramorum TaxID=164328 RepID=H3GZQ5_PHYRM
MVKGNFANPFRRMSLTLADMNELEAVAKTIVEANMDPYLQFWELDNRRVSPNDWKLIKSRDGMHVYTERRWRRRPSLVDSGSDLQSILCVGSTPGTLDDVMLGVMSPTLDVTRTKASYMNDLCGAAVLSTVKEPTSEDSFKSVAVKWMELDVRRRSMRLAKNRDYVYVEATGVKTLPSGERLGYHVMHSVDIPAAHELSGRVRAKLSVCSFFRQKQGNSVAVYALAMMDPMSDRVRRVVLPCFIKTLLSTLKYAHCGEMKKLSQALSERYAELKHVGPPSPDHNCISCMKPVRVWKFGQLMSMHGTCKLCFGYVCHSCKIDKKLSFTTPDLKTTQRKVTFCSSCISDVMAVSPSARPKPSDYWGYGGSFGRPRNQSALSSGWGTALENESSAVSFDFANTR